MIILLCGFMGAGKTTFLKKISELKDANQYIFMDFDEEIAKRFSQEGMSLADYINQRGWANFREREKQLLRELGNETDKQMIIGLGGGIVDDENLNYIKSCRHFTLVWINTSFEVCWECIKKEGVEKRPLAQKGREYLEALYFTRFQNYRQASVHINRDAYKSFKTVAQFFKFIEGKARKVK